MIQAAIENIGRLVGLATLAERPHSDFAADPRLTTNDAGLFSETREEKQT